MRGLHFQQMRLLFLSAVLFTSELVSSKPISVGATDQAPLSPSDQQLEKTGCDITPGLVAVAHVPVLLYNCR